MLEWAVSLHQSDNFSREISMTLNSFGSDLFFSLFLGKKFLKTLIPWYKRSCICFNIFSNPMLFTTECCCCLWENYICNIRWDIYNSQLSILGNDETLPIRIVSAKVLSQLNRLTTTLTQSALANLQGHAPGLWDSGLWKFYLNLENRI